MIELTNEQKIAINHGEGDILVSASAGSGKTHVMTSRAIKLISEKKATVKDILAVTFTEAAASEMKERIYNALTDRINNGEEDLSPNIPELATADISTLHSYCARLIRRYFFVVGVSPDFQIADESVSAELKSDAVDKTIREIYTDKIPELYGILKRHKVKRSDKSFKELIVSLYDYANTESDPDEFYGKYVSVYSPDGVVEQLKLYEKFLILKLNNIKDNLKAIEREFGKLSCIEGVNFTQDVIDIIDRVLSGGLYSVKQYEKFSCVPKFKRNLSSEILFFKPKAVALRDEAKKLFAKFSKHLTDEESDKKEAEFLRSHTENLIKIIKRFGEIYSERKKEKNCLDFEDLEHYALKLLSDEKISEEVKNSHKYLFVDEYQDINGVQEEIIKRISKGNLFMVGDVKQSIYGFRGCRPEIFEKKYEDMKNSGKATVLLNDNFRSAPNVIDTVNEIFSFSMKKDLFGLDYKGTSMLKSGGVYDGYTGRTQLHLIRKNAEEKEEETPRIYDIIKEAKIANKKSQSLSSVSVLISKIIEEEYGKEYYDFKEKTLKKVDYKDIAILTRNKSNNYVSGIAQGLARLSIPLSSEVKQNVCDFPEIKTLINALKLVDSFNDDMPLITTLLSPFGGFSEEDLANTAILYSDNGGDFLNGFYPAFIYLANNGDGDLKEKAVRFINYYKELRFLSDFVGARGTLEKLIKDFSYENYLLSSDMGKTKIKRLELFTFSAMENGESLSVREFIKKVEKRPDAFSLSACADENTVKMMTIHASKGLEFPVVIVCGLERKTNSSEDFDEVMCDREFGFAVKRYDDENKTVKDTLLRGIIKEKNKQTRLKEELRLFYVATTRARYSLHLTFEGQEDGRDDFFEGADRFIDYVPRSLPLRIWEQNDLDESVFETEKRKAVLIGSSDPETAREMQTAFSYEYPFTTDTLLPLKTTVTERLENNTDDGNNNHRPVYAIGETDAERGTTAHELLYNYDFKSYKDFKTQVAEMVSNNKIDGEKLKTIDLGRIEKAISTDIFKKIKNADIYKEKGFISEMPVKTVLSVDSDEKILVQGVIDLLAVGNDGATIIDYKYSHLNADGLKEKYNKQLNLYAQATEQILNIKVKEKYLVNIFTGESVKID